MRFLINRNYKEEEALEAMHQPYKKVSVDIETVSLENRLPLGIGIAVSNNLGFYFFNTRDKDAHNLIESAETVVFHNAKYDLTLLKMLGYTVKEYEDTMMMAYSAGILEHSLRDLSGSILFRECPGVTDQWKKKDQGNVGIDHIEMGRICIIHAMNTYALEENLPKTELYQTVDKPCLELLMEMEYWGLLIDQYTLTRVEQEVVNQAFPMEKELTAELNVKNLASNPQVAKSLKNLGIVGTRKTKSDRDSVSEESLRPLGLPLTDKILKWRSLMKNLTTYVPALRATDSNGRVSTNFGFTNTGRWSSSEPNLQNLTRDNKYEED